MTRISREGDEELIRKGRQPIFESTDSIFHEDVCPLFVLSSYRLDSVAFVDFVLGLDRLEKSGVPGEKKYKGSGLDSLDPDAEFPSQ